MEEAAYFKTFAQEDSMAEGLQTWLKDGVKMKGEEWEILDLKDALARMGNQQRAAFKKEAGRRYPLVKKLMRWK